MVLIGGVLASAALIPCRGGQTPGAVAGWVLDMYVGNPPSPAEWLPPRRRHWPSSWAARSCLLATLTGALTAAAVLWRQPLDRLRARIVRDAMIFTGLDAMTIPLLRQLAGTGRPAGIVVIEPDGSHPLLDEARATGVRVMIGQPDVRPGPAAGDRGHAAGARCGRLYALREDVAENEAVLTAAETILRRYQPDPDRQPHLIARIDDPRHADHWRGWHAGRSDLWFEDALSAPGVHRVRAARPGLPHWRPGSCCCAGTAPWRCPSCASWPAGPGSNGSSRKPRWPARPRQPADRASQPRQASPAPAGPRRRRSTWPPSPCAG